MKKLISVLSISLLAAGLNYSFGQDNQTNTNTTVTTTTSTSTSTDNDKKGGDGDYAAAYVGFRFMPTFTYLAYRNLDNSTAEATAVLGYGYGGVLGFNLSEHVGLQAEVIYSRLAQKYKIADRVNNVRLDYINIPLMLRLNTGVDKPVNLNFVVGPQLGLNVGSSVNTESNGVTEEVNTKIAVKKGDVGVAYGAGLDFRLGGLTTLDLGFRGVFGLVDISDNSNNLETNDYYVLDKAHVKTYSAYVGLTFGF